MIRQQLNPEQHRYRHVEGNGLCECGKSEEAEVHQKYEAASAPFRAAKLASENPTTGDSGKDSRLRKWQKRLVESKPGSLQAAYAANGLTRLVKGHPEWECWLSAELSRQDRVRQQELKDRVSVTQAPTNITTGPGQLFFAPLGGTDWVDLGFTEEGAEESVSVAENLDPIRYQTKPGYHQNHVHWAFDINREAMNTLKLTFGSAQSGKVKEVQDAIAEVERMMNGIHQNPDDMDKAALRLATLAQEIRTHDEREPQGEEPTITWKHTFSEDGPEYTYVAVKLGDRWHVTGAHQAGTTYVWRDFLSRDWAKPLTEGNFLICTEWTQA